MQQLPSGTVTLLFTDIEGSTHLLQQLGDRYPDVLAEYRSLLRSAFHTCSGQEVDTQGDSFFVAFTHATHAVTAAAEIQRTLSAHDWPDGITIPTRMGLHTGEPELSSEGYIGLDVHHAARIMGVGHGGQVLLSQTTCDLVAYSLPTEVGLRDLGAHRLKDLQQPDHLFQLVIAGLPADFPPLKTLDAFPNNLPVQPTPLIGRTHEIAALVALLHREDVRLLTLTGPGGTGKTRLGLQVAAASSSNFEDGVFFVNLAPLSDPALVILTIASIFDLKEIAGQTLLETLRTYLRNKQHLLLLLDNFEQVDSASVQVAELLATCSNLKIMVTSRIALHLRAEHEFPVSPLALPEPGHLPDLPSLLQNEAVALFLARAQAIKPDFQLTNANASAIAEICLRMDGLPLAIELAAARSKLLPPPALLTRLNQRLPLLTSGARDVPARQQTLRNAIKWSYDLLHPDEQRLFCQLSVFVGGCTLEAAESVCSTSDNGTLTVFDGVASLLDKNLLRQTEQAGGEPRLMMLETIREYGLECLATSGEVTLIRQAHALYYLEQAETFEREFGGPQQVQLILRLELERENLRLALQWLLTQEERGLALRLSGALWRFWRVRSPMAEGLDWLEQALRGSDGVETAVRAKALYVAGELALYLGDEGRASVLGEESLLLSRECGDRHGMAVSLMLLGRVASARGSVASALALLQESLILFRTLEDREGIANSLLWQAGIFFARGDFTRAGEQCEESLQFCRDLGNREVIAGALDFLSSIASVQGEYARSHTLEQESLELSRELGDRLSISVSLYKLVRVAFLQGDLAEALPSLEESLIIERELGDRGGIASVLAFMGEVMLFQGDITRADSLLEESVSLCKEERSRLRLACALSLLAKVKVSQGDHDAAIALYEESLSFLIQNHRLYATSCLEGLADVFVAQNKVTWAAHLWGAAEALREVMGAPLPPVYRADYERSVAAGRTQLGEQAFAAAWAEGRTMTPEQVLASLGIATTLPPTLTEPPAIPLAKLPPSYPDGLTVREVEVLKLVAQGMTNDQVAEQLIVSPRTVNTHLTSIYGKIGVSSRSAATRYAIEHNI